jgi:hypothetical protein
VQPWEVACQHDFGRTRLWRDANGDGLHVLVHTRTPWRARAAAWLLLLVLLAAVAVVPPELLRVQRHAARTWWYKLAGACLQRLQGIVRTHMLGNLCCSHNLAPYASHAVVLLVVACGGGACLALWSLLPRAEHLLLRADGFDCERQLRVLCFVRVLQRRSVADRKYRLQACPPLPASLVVSPMSPQPCNGNACLH